MKVNEICDRLWYRGHPLMWSLWPLAKLYQGTMALRERAYRSGWLTAHEAGVPVIVVGNLTAGGTGKTPLVLWLAEYLRAQGYRPGIVSRGYGGRRRHEPLRVQGDSDPAEVGDEPVLLARRSGCPVVIGRRRHLAAQALVRECGCDIIVSDDGLQHLALARDIEIVVIDGQRRFGNGLCLPAGPLREGRARLRRVDLIVTSVPAGRGEHGMTVQAGALQPLRADRPAVPLADWRGRTVHAIAGTGNPRRFFSLLRRHDLQVIEHPFPDHHRYRIEDLQFTPSYPLVMTEKDAVKCERLSLADAWYVPIGVRLAATFEFRLAQLLQELAHG